MIIGYARVSTLAQKLDRQICQLNEYGCEKIFTGTVKNRNGLITLFEVIRKGDTVVDAVFCEVIYLK